MASDIDLRALSEVSGPERAFLSVYLSGPRSRTSLNGVLHRMRRALTGSDAALNEREHFDENVTLIEKHLEDHPLKSGALCLFSCWALDFFQAIPLEASVEDLVWIDSSPYIRPLAELQDEYETAAVVVADNKKARIFLVSTTISDTEDVVKGNVKNHVRKGGWSQQRYERRRHKELLLYAREIVDALSELMKKQSVTRILLVGGKEILRVVHENLPQQLLSITVEKAVHLGKGEGAVNEDIMELFFEGERRSEEDLWEQIRRNYLRGGLGTVGLEDVLAAAREGRIDTMIVSRTFKPVGRRCRECDHLDVGQVEACSACGATSLYEIDVVNELVEMLEKTGASVDFADPIPALTEVGEIAALLRY